MLIMENLPLFVRANLADVILAVLSVIASIAIVYVIRKHPEKFGISKPLNWKSYLPAVLPVAVVIGVIIVDNNEGMSRATGLGVQNDVLLVRGIMTNYQEDPQTGVEKSFDVDKLFIYNKSNGEIVKRLSHFSAGYAVGDKMLGWQGSYHIIDLKTGEVEQVLSEDEVKEKAATTEKIYKVDYTLGDPAFSITAVKNKTYTYDPIANTINPKNTRDPFAGIQWATNTPLSKLDLFQPRIIGGNSSGLAVLLSYDDLEKNNFLITAVSSTGAKIWSKYDHQIADDLSNVSFGQAIVDDNAIYFTAGNEYLVCLALSDGSLKWKSEL